MELFRVFFFDICKVNESVLVRFFFLNILEATSLLDLDKPQKSLRPWLVESSVIVPFCVITSMHVVIINYFCIKKILFSKTKKQQTKCFFHDFQKIIRKSLLGNHFSFFNKIEYIFMMRGLNND